MAVNLQKRRNDNPLCQGSRPNLQRNARGLSWASARLAPRVPLLVLLVLGLLSALGVLGCSRKVLQPDVLVRDDSQGLLFSWIDGRGELHVERSARDVPFQGRDVVRVLSPSTEKTHDDHTVFLADLRNVRADGTYPVHAASESEFERVLSARRKQAGIRPNVHPVQRSVPGADEKPKKEHGPALPSADVIIYGASWCGACHDAATYFRRKGVAFVEKDIEHDASAQGEMFDKLKAAGLARGSIPVLDVRGHIMVGFSEDSVEEALRK
jgi:glutaredoxin